VEERKCKKEKVEDRKMEKRKKVVNIGITLK